MNLSADWTWLKNHLILLLIVAGLVIGSVYGIESVISAHDHEAAIRMETLAQTLVQQNQAVQLQMKAQIDTLTQQNIALQQEVSSLATAIATRDAKLKMVQAQVPQLSPDQLSLEWQKSVKTGTVKPETGGYLVDQPAAVATLQILEALPVLTQDVADLQKSNSNLNVQLVNETAIYEAEKKSHGSDNDANKAVIAAKDAEIKDVKAQCRKSKLKWFGAGVVVGFIGRGFSKF